MAAVLLATAVLGVVPDSAWRKQRLVGGVPPAPAGGASAAVPGLPPASVAMAAEPAPVPPSGAVTIETVLPASVEAGASEPPAAPAGVAVLRASAESWIEVRDAQGKVMLARTVQAGETVGLDGALPLRLTVGNAAATELRFRGQPVDLTAATRDNVARIELK